ncbi:uncharacterized protein EI90DRAFT_3085938 [Cantharellus anzutake]|uniref:uncharacterized protein n=1 Tax=Cantharellus anzutake TaxID=1750568 RepID=UPI0019070FBE|nr:uncharacterized protein EI90DRAFT_3085938 [Cantharellus anzutake]KAF8316938.1 hypothetical protein EI90DRAFT_3085938 [Cantharellus anzutake]
MGTGTHLNGGRPTLFTQLSRLPHTSIYQPLASGSLCSGSPRRDWRSSDPLWDNNFTYVTLTLFLIVSAGDHPWHVVIPIPYIYFVHVVRRVPLETVLHAPTCSPLKPSSFQLAILCRILSPIRLTVIHSSILCIRRCHHKASNTQGPALSSRASPIP